MLKVSFFLLSLSSVFAVEFKSSIVLTTSDVTVNVPISLPSLSPGQTYRVYATYAAGGDETKARKVMIYDDVGSLNVAGLAKAKDNSAGSYILDDYRILRAPITVHDQNVEFTDRLPYTIYIVSTSVTRFPVVSAQLAAGEVDSNYGFLAAGITVLSAEKYFTMYSFDIGGMSSMVISSVGFDESNSMYNVMSLNSPNEARTSFLSVYGPIATLFNANYGLNARFRFQLSKNTKYDFSLSPGCSFSFLSPGYLTPTQSYNLPYELTFLTDALDRSYKFPTDTSIDLYSSVRDFQSSENILVRVINSANTVQELSFKNDLTIRQAYYANSVTMNVQNQNGAHSPRFLFQITSGVSTALSFAGIFLVALSSRFF